MFSSETPPKRMSFPTTVATSSNIRHIAGNRSKWHLDHGIGVEERDDGPFLVVADVVLENDLFGRDNKFARRAATARS